MNFARLFKSLRRYLGLKQVDMAAVLGISQAAYSKIEAGQRQPDVLTFVLAYRIAYAKAQDGVHGDWEAALYHWELKRKKDK